MYWVLLHVISSLVTRKDRDKSSLQEKKHSINPNGISSTVTEGTGKERGREGNSPYSTQSEAESNSGSRWEMPVCPCGLGADVTPVTESFTRLRQGKWPSEAGTYSSALGSRDHTGWWPSRVRFHSALWASRTMKCLRKVILFKSLWDQFAYLIQFLWYCFTTNSVHFTKVRITD